MHKVALLLIAACAPVDDDGDGWPSDLDCDDADAAAHPASAEVCNGADDDCDGLVDVAAIDATVWFADADGDGVGAPKAFAFACAAPAGMVASADDCDDGDPAVLPGATEACNGVDDDCDGRTDEDALSTVTLYLDQDGDGHGDPTATTDACLPPGNAVHLADDCDDTDAGVFPGAAETCGGADQDCSGDPDDDAIDATLWYSDFDEDGYGWIAVEVASCAAPAGFVSDDADCDDFDADNSPVADERCDYVDNNCDALVDGLDAIDRQTWYRDLDGDGFGTLISLTACFAPADYVGQNGDCDDADGAVSPIAPEICDNGIDDDCDFIVDGCAGVPPKTVFSITDLDVATWTGAANDYVESVAPAGDLDGDGFDDLVIGAPLANVGVLTDPGLVAVLYGSPIPTSADVRSLPVFAGQKASDKLAQYNNLGGVGDLDGDGFGDVIVGAPDSDDPGFGFADIGGAYVLYGSGTRESGATSAASFDAVFTGDQQTSRVGHGVTGLGDVDGDGLDDAAFAEFSNNDFRVGTVRLWYGSTTRASGTVLASTLPSVVGGAFDDGLGHHQGVTGVDLDGDGLSDVLMAGRAGGGLAAPTGLHLDVLYGDPVRPTVVDTSTLPRVADTTSVQSTSYDREVRPAGDLDGDGYADAVIADFYYSSLAGPSSGQLWIVGGGPTRLTGTGDLLTTAYATIEGVVNGAACGWDVRALGDFLGDGTDDLAVTTPYWTDPFTSSGAVGIFDAPLSGEITFDQSAYRIEGSVGDMLLGYSIAPADVNGDGFTDLAIAAPQAITNKGSVTLILGGSL